MLQYRMRMSTEADAASNVHVLMPTEYSAEQHAEVLCHARVAVQVLCRNDYLKSSVICTD
jgi:hypothetical protein